MTATAAPFGLMPIDYPSGRVVPTAYPNGILNGYTSNIGLFTPVALNTSGVLVAASTNADIIGSFAGVEYIQPGATLEIKRTNWLSGTAYTTGTLVAYVYDNPQYNYLIQANGSLAQTSIGDEADFVNPGTVDTQGFSQAAISTTLVGAAATGQLRIIQKGLGVNNDWGDAYTQVIVTIARHQYFATKAAI